MVTYNQGILEIKRLEVKNRKKDQELISKFLIFALQDGLEPTTP